MVRRALAMAAGEQYARLVINFASIAIVSRLLTPAEIGVSVIGTGIVLVALGLREFATSDFLIQRQEVLREDIRTSFTLAFLLTALITALMFVLAPWFARLYGEPQLADFVRIAAVGGLIEAVSLPIRGLLRREMEFGTLALVNTASIAVAAAVTIVLALAGQSYMSVAWGLLAAALATTVLSFYVRPDLSILRPAFRSWGSVLSFGGYNGASFVINRAYEALPQLVLGQLLPPAAVGVYNRAQMVSDIPDKIVLDQRLLDRVPGARGGDPRRPQPQAALPAGARPDHRALLAGARAAGAARRPDRGAGAGRAVAGGHAAAAAHGGRRPRLVPGDPDLAGAARGRRQPRPRARRPRRPLGRRR